ncbi:MAG TPA: radical SAM protein [Candidatus Thermoplasmatota archaeon]|nr:radical SAM protein [Candidatus Thermoplasmatota archaeon]
MRASGDYRDDAVHPTLRRALPVAQATLDGGAPGRSAYGACDVLETMGGQGLTDFTFGGTTTGEAWSINPYSGCQHACTYCYVPDTVKAERGRWGRYAVVKRDLPTQLSRLVRKRQKMTVYLSTATDPYQPLEAEHGITRKCLEVLVRKDWPVEVLTRSPLVLRDLDLLTQLSQVRVGLSIPMLDDRVRRALEPLAPAIPARLRALRKLSDAGIPTFANYTPACPPTTHDADAVARTFLEAGAQWVNSKGLQRQETTLVPMWDRLHGTEFEDLTRFLASRPRQEAWHQELGRAFRKVGLAFSTPFFNPPFPAPEATAPGRQAKLGELPRLPVLVPTRLPRRAAAAGLLR